MTAPTERQSETVVVLMALSPWAWADLRVTDHAQRAIASLGPTAGLTVCPAERAAEATARWGYEVLTPSPSASPALAALHHLLAQVWEVAVLHDACWPLARPELVHAVREKALTTGAALAAGPVKETIKQVRGGLVTGTVSREEMAQAQWPAALTRAAAEQVVATTADAPADTPFPALIFAAGLSLGAVTGPPENSAITSAADLAVARALLARR